MDWQTAKTLQTISQIVGALFAIAWIILLCLNLAPYFYDNTFHLPPDLLSIILSPCFWLMLCFFILSEIFGGIKTQLLRQSNVCRVCEGRGAYYNYKTKMLERCPACNGSRRTDVLTTQQQQEQQQQAHQIVTVNLPLSQSSSETLQKQFCSFCGKEIDADAIYCKYCGKQQRS
jgi:hypothetical protein